MRIVTNPGLNLTADEIRRHRVVIMPQRIMVDGSEHDTRKPISFAVIDRWMRDAKRAPHVVGTTAAEFVDVFRRTVAEDPDLLVMTASKKLIGTYQAAVSAARTFAAMPGHARARVVPFDTERVDVAGALAVDYAAEAAQAGLSMDRVVEHLRAFTSATGMIAVPGTLDNLVKGGRATFLRALVADTLGISPLIGFADGEMSSVGKVKRSEMVAGMRDHVLSLVGRGAKLWIGVAHGGNEASAQALIRELSSVFSVLRSSVRPQAPTTYLNIGPSSLVLSFTVVDRLAWMPPAPPMPPVSSA